MRVYLFPSVSGSNVYLFPSVSGLNVYLFLSVSGSNRDLERTDVTGMMLQSFRDNPAEVHLSIRADRNVCAEGPCAGCWPRGQIKLALCLPNCAPPVLHLTREGAFF